MASLSSTNPTWAGHTKLATIARLHILPIKCLRVRHIGGGGLALTGTQTFFLFVWKLLRNIDYIVGVSDDWSLGVFLPMGMMAPWVDLIVPPGIFYTATLLHPTRASVSMLDDWSADVAFHAWHSLQLQLLQFIFPNSFTLTKTPNSFHACVNTR